MKQPKKGRHWLNDGSCKLLRPAYGANKNARIAWALLQHGEDYDQRLNVSAM